MTGAPSLGGGRAAGDDPELIELAQAELPAALDRVPDSALVTASIGNLEAFIGDARQLQGGRDMLGGGAEAIGAAGQLLETDGIDRDGAVARQQPLGRGEVQHGPPQVARREVHLPEVVV